MHSNAKWLGNIRKIIIQGFGCSIINSSVRRGTRELSKANTMLQPKLYPFMLQRGFSEASPAPARILGIADNLKAPVNKRGSLCTEFGVSRTYIQVPRNKLD